MPVSEGRGALGRLEAEKAKIIFQFSLMLIVSVIGGICLAKLVRDEVSEGLSEIVCRHFLTLFTDGVELRDGVLYILRLCTADIACICIMLIFSFSFINYTVTDMVMVFCGFRFGLDVAVVFGTALKSIGGFDFAVFVVLRAAVALVLLAYACKTAIYSLNIRRFSYNGRLIISPKSVITAFLLTLTLLGAVLFINGLYCLLIYIF